MKLLIFIGMTAGSFVGWWLGEQVSDDLMVQFLLSGVGSVVGVWLGWKLGQNLD